jgi:hypothetical protein
VKPNLTRSEEGYIGAAWRAAVARDRACGGSAGPELTNGSPSRAPTSTFAILRRLATRAPKLRSLLQTRYGDLPRVVKVGNGEGYNNEEIYLNQIRRARSAFGASFYVFPAGNVTTRREVPQRCDTEQMTALERQLSHLPAARRAQILGAQAMDLAYLRYLTLHPEGICATFVRHPPTPDITDGLMCATLADFERWEVLADASSYLGGRVAVFWTAVPDGVATVTLRFTEPNGRPLATSTTCPVNNVVVAREPYDAPYQSGFPSTIVLRAADGHVIKRIAVTPNMPTLCATGASGRSARASS